MKKIIIPIMICIVIILLIVLYKFNIIPHNQYTNDDFNIKIYISR